VTGLTIKLAVCPAVVYLSDVIFRQVNYAALWQPILVGLLIAVAAHAIEVIKLMPGTLWLSSGFDFMAATVIVYLSALALPGAFLTFPGVLLTALFLTLTEIPQHYWLIKSGMAE